MIEILETNADVALYPREQKTAADGYRKRGYFPRCGGRCSVRFPERMITVDAGAIPYVVNGADVMRPGIVAVSDDVVAGSPVQIADERHKKPLAIGVALMDGPAIRASASGKMCKNFHHVGDELWNLEL